MRVLYAGTPAIAVPALEALVDAGHAVEVLTNADAPAGRGGHSRPSPVKEAALARGLTVHQPERLDAGARSALAGRFDLLVSFAYGRIFGPLFLGLFPEGGLNLHPSLLPRWRGPSPLSAALLARDTETGLCVQRLALAMDSGDVLARERLALTGNETTGSLTLWAAATGARLLTAVLSGWQAALAGAQAQDEAAATYCHLVAKEEGRLDWTLTAVDLEARFRAFDPWPGVFTTWRGERLQLRQATVLPPRQNPAAAPGLVLGVDTASGILVQTGHGVLAVRELQLPSRKSLEFRSFLNGNPALLGSRLGESE